MPELPEVETVRRGLEPAMAGQTFEKVEQRRADLRFPFPADFAARLTGRRIEAITRRAKYLFADLDDGADKEIVSKLKADRPTPHDLRRTVATQLAALGIPREDRMAVLDHSDGDVHDIHYDRHDRLREKRVALDAWSRKVAEIIGDPEPKAKVVAITARRR